MDCPFPRHLRSQGIWVPCGKCVVCKENRAQDWSSRLQIEKQYSSSAYFVTLTYDDEHLPHDEFGEPCFSKSDVQLFHKRVRACLHRGSVLVEQPPFKPVRLQLQDRKFRYWLNSEYGSEGEGHRPHYHAIYFDLPDDIYLADCLMTYCWQKGHVELSQLTTQRIGYAVEYAIDFDLRSLPFRMKPFMLCSKGLGSSLLNSPSGLDWWRSSPANRVYIPARGEDGKREKRRLPRYLKGKIFDDDMRARIAEVYAERSERMSLRADSVKNAAKVNSYNEYKEMKFRSLVRRKSHI